MLWLWAFAIPGILGVLGYGYQKFQCRHHQEMPYRQEFLLAMLIALVEASLNCLFLLLPLFAYQGYDETNLAELLLGFDLFLQALSPREIILSIHEKHRFPKFDLWKILQNSLFALVLLVELFLFNFKSFSEKAFLFSPLRFYGLGALVYLGLALLRLVLKPAAPSFTSRKPYFVLLGAAIVATLGFVLLVSLNASRYFTTYPFQQSDTNSNPFLYYNLFQAFKNGHVYLDDIPDSRLAGLTNPYDPYARHGIPYLWDTAYYQGKYYCYYGPAPVILVMFPVYWLTGHVPTGLFLEVFALILYTFGFIYTSLRLNKLGKNPLPWPLWSLLTSVALLSSLSLNFVAYRLTDWKYILPFDFGLAFAVWFFGLVLTAYQSPSLRMLYLGMAGFFYVALMASRPDLGIVLLFSWPLLLKLFFMKDKAVGQRFLDFVPMVGILLVGAGLLIAYNVARYGKITEFGQDYQLTALDCSQQK